MLAQEYFDEAKKLGKKIAEKNQTLVYGGARVGLMGEVARSAKYAGANVIGILPENLLKIEIEYAACDELIITANMRERKALLESKSDAFIALPGGFGTFEELLEILTLKQLNLHHKPVILINTLGYYDKLIDVFEYSFSEHFAKPIYRTNYYLATDTEDAYYYLSTYKHKTLPIETRWIKKEEE